MISKQNQYFDCISNQTRREIIKLLQKRGYRLSHLAKDLRISVQAIEKHIKKLTDARLVEKNGTELHLTEMSRIISHQIDSLEFLEDNKAFLKKYSLSYFPKPFIQRIGDLKEFEKITGYVATIERYKKILEETKEFAKIIAPEVSLDIYKEGMPILQRNNVHVSYILGENSIVPKGWKKLTKQMREKSMISNGTLKRRLTKKVHITMYLSENESFIALPNKEGTSESSIMLASKNENFRQWCIDLFDYYWNHSHTFSEEKIHET